MKILDRENCSKTLSLIIRLLTFIFLLLLISASGIAQVIPRQDEFVGPFASWLNVKTSYGAVGNGVHDDTASLQNCIDATSASKTCYIPNGTYKITSTLFVKNLTSTSLVGQDEANTIIKYAGATGQIMIWVNGCHSCRFERMTLDGSGIASTIGFASKYDHAHVPTQTSKNMYQDITLKNLDKGIAAGGAPPASQGGQSGGAAYCQNDDTTDMRRLVFTNLTTAGVSVECVNALLWTCWDCTFINATRGMTNEFGNGGQFSAYRSVFYNSSVADITIGVPYYYWVFTDNWSVGSNRFFKTTANNAGCNVLLRGNHVINTTQNVSFDMENRGPFVLVDNTIVSKTGSSGPVFNTANSGTQILSIGNTFTVSNKISGGIQREIDDVVVAASSVNQTPPTLPPANPNLNRTIFDVPSGASAATIQTAINSAAAAGNRSVVHLPAGAYNIASTLTIPANTPIQIIGDGWGTQLYWPGSSGGVMWSLAGPSLAKFDLLYMVGGGTADLIRVNDSDQVGGHVYGDFIESDSNGVDYLADQTVNTNIDLEFAFVGVSAPSNVGVRSIGAGGSSRIALFGTDSGNSAGTLYSVRNGGNVVAEDMYYEGPILPLVNMGPSESGNITLAGFKGGVDSANCTNSSAAYIAGGMGGSFSLISGSTINCGSYLVSGSSASQNFLGLGLGYGGTSDTAGYASSSPGGIWGFVNNTIHDAGGHSIPAADAGTATDTFTRAMLAQWRGTKSSYLSPQVSGTTNVRVFRTLMRSGRVGLHVMGGGGGGGDRMPPSAPGSLTTAADSSSQINLSWTASTDNAVVTEYLVERCQGAGCSNFTQVAAATGNAYSDTGLAANTSYNHRVRATDAAGNLSAYSNVATATTLQGTISSPSGLVAAYAFNEGTGTTVADASGNGNTGTITSATWTTGKYGRGLSFNGTNALVTVKDSASLHLTNAMTLEGWVNPGTAVHQWEDIIYKGNDNYYLEATSSKNVPAGGGTVGTQNAVAYGIVTLPQNSWSHVALTYDGATLRLYVNGVQVSSQARTGNIVTSTNPLQIGGDSLFTQFFKGIIDEVRIYNVALAAAQIQSDMNMAIAGGGI